ncbi:MAG: hypothetical protein AABY22_31875, partial [Nanoarchaeota archaeon]
IEGLKIALTNDVDAEYLDAVRSRIKNNGIFAYREGLTPTSLVVSEETTPIIKTYITDQPKIGRIVRPELAIINSIKNDKGLSDITIIKLRKGLGIAEMKNATEEQLAKMIDILQGMEFGDSLLTELQQEALTPMIEMRGRNPGIITKREVYEQFGEIEELMRGRITKFIAKELIPTVDIKTGHPIVEKIADKADDLLFKAEQKTAQRNDFIDNLLKKAEAERSQRLTLIERTKRYLAPQNKEIFQAMSGIKIELTKSEAAVVAYLRNFFAKARNELKLERIRQNYITHLEKPLIEKILNDGVLSAVKGIFKIRETNIPLNIALELDHILGSEKFFRF